MKTLFLATLGLVAVQSLIVGFAEAVPGDLDRRFNPCPASAGPCDGMLTTDLGAEDAVNSVAIQRDGKIIAVGGYNDFRVVRYKTDGRLDPDFGQGGKVSTDFGTDDGREQAKRVAVLPDGDLIVAGETGSGGPVYDADTEFVVVRYNSDGTLDRSFGSAGKVTTNWAYQEALGALVIQDDGKIVIAGTGWPATDEPKTIRPGAAPGFHNFGLIRYAADGVPDLDFGVGGTVTAEDPSFHRDGDLRHLGLVVQENGKIVVGGTGYEASQYDFVLRRFNTDGTGDSSFGENGKTVTDLGGNLESISALIAQPSGQLVAAGVLGNKCDSCQHYITADFGLVRYSADGIIDSGFGNGGKVRTDFGRPIDSLAGAAVEADGGIVAVGSTCLPQEDSSDCEFAIARYGPAGQLDETFSGDGKVSSNFGPPHWIQERGNSVAIGEHGTILVGGQSADDFALSRYLDREADLSIDLVAAPDPVLVDKELTYTVTVTNHGPDNVRAVVTPLVASDAKVVSFAPSQGDCKIESDGPVCHLGQVASGATSIITVRATAPAKPTQLTTKVIVSGQHFDSHLANNTKESVTSVVAPGASVESGVAAVTPGKALTEGSGLASQNPGSPTPPSGPPHPTVSSSSSSSGPGLTSGSPAGPPPPPAISHVAQPVPQAPLSDASWTSQLSTQSQVATRGDAQAALRAVPGVLPESAGEPAPRYSMVKLAAETQWGFWLPVGLAMLCCVLWGGRNAMASRPQEPKIAVGLARI